MWAQSFHKILENLSNFFYNLLCPFPPSPPPASTSEIKSDSVHFLKIIFSSSVKNTIGSLIGIALNKQTTNLKNIQATPTAQLQKNKWPNQKMGQRTK